MKLFIGEFGTLAAVSAVTSAVKSLASHGIKLIGYNGLMLPVMEDLILAERASQNPPTFSLRDLLIFSSVCGVGLDTVPVPGAMCEKVKFILQLCILLPSSLSSLLEFRYSIILIHIFYFILYSY